jgi:hypothetical protein
VISSLAASKAVVGSSGVCVWCESSWFCISVFGRIMASVTVNMFHV